MKIIVISDKDDYAQFVKNLDKQSPNCCFSNCNGVRCENRGESCGDCITRHVVHVDKEDTP